MLRKAIAFYYSRDNVNFICFVVSILLSLFLALVFIITRNNLPSDIPIYYSMSWGNSQLAENQQFFLFPLLILLITMVNIVVSWHLHASQVVLRRIIGLSTLFISFLILITGFKIIYIFL